MFLEGTGRIDLASVSTDNDASPAHHAPGVESGTTVMK